jgi:hypothetical protein
MVAAFFIHIPPMCRISTYLNSNATHLISTAQLTRTPALGLIYTLRCGNTFILAPSQLAESQYENVAAMQSINQA